MRGSLIDRNNNFIDQSKLIHNDKYDYSLVDYVDARHKVKIICPIHGVFEQLPYNHLFGKGCLDCGGKKKITTEEFIRKAKLKYGDKYNYSLSVYINDKTKLKIICTKHGMFEQVPYSHLGGNGCPKCANNQQSCNREFISKAQIIHANKYDYSLVNYTNNHTKVKITCLEHGVFEQAPFAHLSSNGCHRCINNKWDNLSFVTKASSIHNNKYDYSLIEYVCSKCKVKIICQEHGIFEQNPDSHLRGAGCPDCGGRKILTTDLFTKRANLVHSNKYDYSLSEYINAKSKIKIICPEHGIFEQKSDSHLRGCGCNRCGDIGSSMKQRSNNDDFILKAKTTHKNKFDYSLVIYIDNHTKVKIKCPIHGIFEQTPNTHLLGGGCSRCNESKGERIITNFLTDNNIPFKKWYRFKDCKYKNPLSFDFYLPDYNTCIEYNGIQHYKPVKRFGGEYIFVEQQTKDNIKISYCITNNINLEIIKYSENIVTSLNNLLSKILK
jgi:DNA-directed RNA polymerase subunit RPC12/RpoP